jgi:hypothetical protein
MNSFLPFLKWWRRRVGILFLFFLKAEEEPICKLPDLHSWHFMRSQIDRMGFSPHWKVKESSKLWVKRNSSLSSNL